MKAAKDREEEFYDPARKDNIFGKATDITGAVGRAPQRPRSALKIHIRVVLWLKVFSEKSRELQWPGFRHFAKDVGETVLGRRLVLLGPVGRGALACIIQLLELPGEVWAAWRAFLLSLQEGASGSHEGKYRSNPFVSAKTLKAFAALLLSSAQRGKP